MSCHCGFNVIRLQFLYEASPLCFVWPIYRYSHSQKCARPNKNFTPNWKQEIYKGSHLFISWFKSPLSKYHSSHVIIENSPPFLINNMVLLYWNRKIKRLPFKRHCHRDESTLAIQRTPQPQKCHHQINSKSSSQHAKQLYYYV